MRVPRGLTALMSATAVPSLPAPLAAAAGGASGGAGGGDWEAFAFEQRVPISSYLIALVVGQLASRDLSPRCRRAPHLFYFSFCSLLARSRFPPVRLSPPLALRLTPGGGGWFLAVD